jgi:hypothetical protein
MPLIRDDEEERRTRIEHMLEQLQHDSVSDGDLTRIQTATAPESLRPAPRMSKAARLERDRARTDHTAKSQKR